MSKFKSDDIAEEKKAVRIVCEHCGGVFILYPETARDFYDVHECYREKQKIPG